MELEIVIDPDIWIPFYEPECTIVVPAPENSDEEATTTAATLARALKGQPASDHPLEVSVIVRRLDKNKRMQQSSARAIITWCRDRKWISATFRFPEKALKLFLKDNSAQRRPGIICRFNNEFVKHQYTERIKRRSLRMREPDKAFFLQTDAVTDVLMDALFAAKKVVPRQIRSYKAAVEAREKGIPRRKPAIGLVPGLCQSQFMRPIEVKRQSGVLVFAGATKCGKSQVATASILRYLLALASQKRSQADDLGGPIHLVTAEDPIEPFLMHCDNRKVFLGPDVKQNTVDNRSPIQFGIWMTSRMLKKDVIDLGCVYKNALRQTPECVFVGEAREADDWRAILELGATGHLVVTTMHAGSISEAMNRIMAAQNVSTPFQRVNLSRTLLGICHMGRQLTDHGPVILPALWRRTSMSISAFGTDGLASMIPNKDYLLGRRTIAQQAMKMQDEYGDPQHEHADLFLKLAQKLDLIEM